MIVKSEDYRWSSAAAHCGLTEDPMLTVLPVSMKDIAEGDRSEWLSIPETRVSLILFEEM